VTNNKNICELSSVMSSGAAQYNLRILLGQDGLSREDFLKKLGFIRSNNFGEYNKPSSSDLAIFASLEEHLQNGEPNQLPSFELLQQLRSFTNSLKEFEPRWFAQADLLAQALRMFEGEIELYLSALYAKNAFREFRFPSWISGQESFHQGMAVLQLTKADSSELTAECGQLWMELLDLWLKLIEQWEKLEWMEMISQCESPFLREQFDLSRGNLPQHVRKQIEDFRGVVKRSL
jgi:hypothetical protein